MNPFMPLISVLLPAHNARPYIREAVESVLAQTLSDFELLVHDDGSTDGTPEVLRDLADADRRVRLTCGPNRGLVSTLNMLFARARGMYIARMDADDVCTPRRFAAQVERLESSPQTVCIGGAVVLMDASGKPVHHPTPVLGDEAVQLHAMAGRTPLCHPATMFRAGAMEQVGAYRSEMWPAEDLDLFLRLGEIGLLDNVPETVLHYRLHATSISASRAEQQRERMRAVCSAAALRRGRTINFDDGASLGPGDGADFTALSIPGVTANPTARALVLASAHERRARPRRMTA